jgi:AcrR family transcriptional regulator
VSSPSDAPVRAPGSHTRSGNAMLRTRTAILAAAADCVARGGVRRTTMSEVSSSGGIAKATLYNHFRTKDDLLEGLLLAWVADVESACVEAAGDGLVAALQEAATRLGACAPLRRVVEDDPAVAGAFAVPRKGRPWEAARAAVAAVLAASGVAAHPAAVDLVLRWAAAQAVWPGSAEEVALGARALGHALAGRGAVAGLGWPGA